MSHRNIILFEGNDRTLVLIAQGSFWPIAVEVDGEIWERTEEVATIEAGKTARLYRHAPSTLRSA